MQYFGFDKNIGQGNRFGFGDAAIINPELPVSKIPTDYILRYNLDGDAMDSSTSGLDGVLTGSTGFVAGRKPNTQALKFSVGCLKSSGIVPINSSCVTASMWFKKTTPTFGAIIELSSSPDANNAFNSLFSNYANDGRLTAAHSNKGTNVTTDTTAQSLSDGVWHHLIIQFGRNPDSGVSANIVYLDGIQLSLTSNSKSSFTGNFKNDVIFFGQRDSQFLPYDGLLQDIRIYNRPLMSLEIAQLFNE